MSNRRANVQGEFRRILPIPYGTIAWHEHLEAWEAYAKIYGRDQSAERMHERGGFGLVELCSFLGRPPRTWQPIDEHRRRNSIFSGIEELATKEVP